MNNSKKSIKWGFMGAGAILDRWMKGAAQCDDMEIVAIASRTTASADRMAKKYNIPNVLSYCELVKREEIDVVYVNTIHPAHAQLAIMAMENGKNVLVEKPAAVNEKDFIEMTECAKKNNVFLMEAVWTRFFPIFKSIDKVVESGKIGKIRLIQSSFGFSVSNESKSSRLFDENQAGGSLLDVGIYNLNFANIILKKHPSELIGMCSMDTDENHYNVDETAGVIAKFDTGEIAMMTSSIRSKMSETAYIYGSKGYIEIPHFYKPETAYVYNDGEIDTIISKVPQKIDGIVDEGYQFEIDYVNECVRNNVKCPQYVTWDNTRTILAECDKLREQCGIVYPLEK